MPGQTQQNGCEEWDAVFQNERNKAMDHGNLSATGQHIQDYYLAMTGRPAIDCVLSSNFAKWDKTAQKF